MTADGKGVAAHAGTRLLAEMADFVGLTSALSDALAPTVRRKRRHDPGGSCSTARSPWPTAATISPTWRCYAISPLSAPITATRHLSGFRRVEMDERPRRPAASRHWRVGHFFMTTIGHDAPWPYLHTDPPIHRRQSNRMCRIRPLAKHPG